MSEEKKLTEEELEQAVGGRNEVKRKRKIFAQQLEERALAQQAQQMP